MKQLIINALILLFGLYLYYRDSSPVLNKTEQQTIIVIGGGLAGLSAAIEAHYQENTKVILIEKENNLGGNSIKATSGINALQGDRQTFIQDTLESGGGKSQQDLVIKLVDESQEAIQWLIQQSRVEDQPTLDLSLVSRCGGHSIGRTHRCPAQNGRPVPVGWKLIDTLKRQLNSLDHVDVLTNARVLNLLTNVNGAMKGVMVSKKDPDTGKQSMQMIHANAVVLASGGFGGQTGQYLPDGQVSLLSQVAPQHLDRATTNGPWASGDGIRLATIIGAGTVDMDQVQVHPTGFIDPKQPIAPTKFLAPEALRAYGGILLNEQGKRFVDELTLRDRVTAAIFNQSSTLYPNTAAVYLILTEDAVDGFGKSTLEFYASKGLVNQVESIEKLADLLKVHVQELKKEFQEYDNHIEQQQPDKTGKTFFPGRLLNSKGYWVSIVTPVVHYTMGGLMMNTRAEILKNDGTPIPGLFGAGEVTGGLHGQNRLAGNSLLECVVYGRTAGRHAAMYAKNFINI